MERWWRGFDWRYYLDCNPDITPTEEGARRHYLKLGYKEHRSINRVPRDLDWKAYVAQLNKKTWRKDHVNHEDHIFSRREAMIHFLAATTPLGSYPVITEETTPNIKMVIVYFIGINPARDWRVIVRGQMSDMRSAGILRQARLYPVIYGEQEQDREECVNEFFSNLSNIEPPLLLTENHHEYPALKRLWELAHHHPDKIFLYLHSKGMFTTEGYLHQRHPVEEALTGHTLFAWQDVVHLFETQPLVMKAGLLPGYRGFVFYNFWYARGSYLARCDPPVLTLNRHDNELWLGYSGSGTWTDTYAILEETIRYYSGTEATTLMQKLL